MEKKKVDIIVVNWNSAELTLRAVRPYLNYSSPEISCKVIVVDNASSDNSLVLFKDKINNLIVNKKNLGFGKACNQALTGSDADYILLLNPDTISQPEVLENLIRFLETKFEYAVSGPAQLDANGKVLKTCGRFPTFKTALFEVFGLSKVFPKIFTPAPGMTDWDHSQSKEVDHVMGSFMVIKKAVLDSVGFFDERYFVYMEDIDLSRRINDAGFKTFYNHKQTVFHEGGGTGENLKQVRLFYSLSSRRIYWRKYFTKFHYLILLLLSIAIEPFLRMIDSLKKEKKLNIVNITRAYLMYIHKFIVSKNE